MEIKSPLPIDEITTILPNTTTADSRQGVHSGTFKLDSGHKLKCACTFFLAITL